MGYRAAGGRAQRKNCPAAETQRTGKKPLTGTKDPKAADCRSGEGVGGQILRKNIVPEVLGEPSGHA